VKAPFDQNARGMGSFKKAYHEHTRLGSCLLGWSNSSLCNAYGLASCTVVSADGTSFDSNVS
jgi:hypothetical protein